MSDDLRVKTCETCRHRVRCAEWGTACEEWERDDRHIVALGRLLAALDDRYRETNDSAYSWILQGILLGMDVRAGRDVDEALADIEFALREPHDTP